MFCESSECSFAVPYEYLCPDTCGHQGGYGTSPFCATMGQPFIYYCTTPQSKVKPKCGNVQRDNKNFFAKAFQWYTQEHVPHREESAKKSGDVKGFATWLDCKYDQFLLDQCDSCGYKLKHTSIIEAYRFPNEPCESRRKKFRVKSPWRKKRSHKETGDSKCSLHYIMKPKEISRPASETNDMSKAMMMSSEVVLSHCSYSCSSLKVLRESSVTVPKRSQDATQSAHSVKLNKKATKSLSKIHPGEPQSVICMCSKVSKKNAVTQSEPWPSKNEPKFETASQTVPKSEGPPLVVPKSEGPPLVVPKSEDPPLAEPKSEIPLLAVPKCEGPSQVPQKESPCLCHPVQYTKISHPTKIEIEFETQTSPVHMEVKKCQCAKEIIGKADAQCQYEINVNTCSCGPDDYIEPEKSLIIPKKVRLHPCKCGKLEFQKCPLEPTDNNSNHNQPILCNQCVPCKRSVVVTDGSKVLSDSHKTTTGPNGLLTSNTANTKRSGYDGILSANHTTTNNGLRTSNPTTIANNGVQTSNHSIRIEKDGVAPAGPLFMRIVFADKTSKF